LESACSGEVTGQSKADRVQKRELEIAFLVPSSVLKPQGTGAHGGWIVA